MKRLFSSILMLLCLSAGALAQDAWRLALPGWKYEFPRDHGLHADFQTEWWYFTGNLIDENGRFWGYQLTFFRQGAYKGQEPQRSRFIVRDLKFAHFAVSDLGGGLFRFAQKTSRGSFGEAGFGSSGEGELAWIENWRLGSNGHSFVLKAAHEDAQIELELRSRKQPVIHGANGISQKAEGEGRASHYYSLTRLETEGWLSVGGRRLRVNGESWFDHEWATNQLAANQVGWDWFSLQFEDATELMIYQMRCKDGSVDPYSSGSFIDAKGGVTPLSRDDYRLTPLRFWKSSKTQATYPVAWKIEVPSLGLNVEVETPLDSQELVLKPIAYWEGAVRAKAMKGGRSVLARGYMELTGYSGALVGIQAP